MMQEPRMTKENRNQAMSNKQVIAIFIIGVGLLLGAFWAGLYVVKQDTDANTNQALSTARAAQPTAAGKQPTANSNSAGHPITAASMWFSLLLLELWKRPNSSKANC